MALIMRDFLRRWWPVLKVLMVVAVIIGVGWHLLGILHNEQLSQGDERTPAQVLWDEICAANLGGQLACAALYLGGLGFSAAFWVILIWAGDRLPAVPGVRAYYLSHLGKYVPVKGWALIMRTSLAAEAGCRPGVAVLTAVYEVLATMTAGALLAALLLVVLGGESTWLWQAVALTVLAGVPILPGVFNRVVDWLARRFQTPGGVPLPRPRTGALLFGLLITGLGWFLLGASLQALLLAMGVESLGGLAGWMEATAFIAVSNVGAFVTPSPAGLGVREFLLQQMLAPQMGARAVVVVLLLRLLWTVAEVLMGALVWWLPAKTELRNAPGLS
jgi:hypothetical protein